MKVVMLLENTSSDPRLTAEHGLSLCIETKKHRILFDTGQSDAFSRNAEMLGIDLRDVDMAVISHGHYDHTGGLLRFLEINDHAPVYVHKRAFERHRSGDGREIGMDASLAENPRIVLTDGRVALDDGLWLDDCNDGERPFASHSGNLLMLRNDRFVPDDFCHEQYLNIRESGRLVTISGCSHKGVLNILHWFRPDVFIGGFHFMSLDMEKGGRAELEEAATALSGLPTRYCTCHCTGQRQFEVLKRTLGDRILYLSGGMSLTLP